MQDHLRHHDFFVTEANPRSLGQCRRDMRGRKRPSGGDQRAAAIWQDAANRSEALRELLPLRVAAIGAADDGKHDGGNGDADQADAAAGAR